MESVQSGVLLNCTSQLLEFDELANISSPLSQNQSSIHELLQIVYDVKDTRLSIDIKRKAKEFISSCILPSRPYDLVWWQKLVWTVVFAMMLLVATGGNSIVIWIVLAHRRMRTVTNYFLVNLSISDLMMSLLNCICNFIFMLNSNWPFGTVYCSLNNFVSSVTVSAGVFTLMVISFDRYMAIVRPLQHRMTHKKARIALVVIWVASGLLGVPPLLYSTTMTRRSTLPPVLLNRLNLDHFRSCSSSKYADGQTRIICYMLWPDGAYPTSVTEYVYNLIFLAVTYLIPMTVMAVCYTLMGIELWGSRSIGEFTQRQMDSIKSKRKVVRMFILVVSIFAFCWLPYHGYFIYAYHDKSIAGSAYVQHLFLCFYWLAMSNAMVNPIIYYWMNTRFRIYFQRVICCCCSRWKYKNEFPIIPNVKRVCAQSDFGRTKSDESRFATAKWQRRTENSEVIEIPTCGRQANDSMVAA